jgi:uncharacterized protein (UPF0218 family)
MVAVGDAVTDHLLSAGHRPHLAVIDGRTERAAVAADRRDRLPVPDRTVMNPPGALSAALLAALREGVDTPAPTVVRVAGEEDLAALPALLLVPADGSVVYGQPGAGMVLVTVDSSTRARARTLLSRMNGDVARAATLLGLGG